MNDEPRLGYICVDCRLWFEFLTDVSLTCRHDTVILPEHLPSWYVSLCKIRTEQTRRMFIDG